MLRVAGHAWAPTGAKAGDGCGRGRRKRFAPAGGVALAGFFALFPAAVGLLIWVGLEWRRRRAEVWWESVWRSAWETPQEVQGFLEAHRDDAWAHETVIEAVRRLLEAVANDVAPAFGSLTAEYLREQKEPDSFFRGVARLLADLSPQEYQDLGALLGSICGSEGDHLAIERKSAIEGSVLEIRILPSGDNVAQAAHQSACPQSFVRLRHQLKVHELAEDAPTGGFVGKGGPNVMLISRTTAARLRAHVR